MSYQPASTSHGALLAVLIAISGTAPAESQGPAKRHPSGTLTAEYQWKEGGKKSSDSFTIDEGACVVFLTFYPDGGMKFSYTYYRDDSQTWDYSSRQPQTTQFRKTERKTTYRSGRLVPPAGRPGSYAGASPVVEQPFADSIAGNQQLREYPDGSADLSYAYPGRIPIVVKSEVINTSWGGRVTTQTTEDWHEATARCEPYMYVWRQWASLRSTRGPLDQLAGSVGPTQQPRTNRWITVRWNLRRP